LGTNAAMQDAEILAFLRAHGATARNVTSVCTGAIILGAAGLLDGYRTATHWSSYDGLDALGVDGIHGRVVADRRRTGGGVTAGIDFGLSLLAGLRGETVAKITQLMLEYDPQPPFTAGSPKTAEPEILETVVGMLKGLGNGGLDAMVATARKARRSVCSDGLRRPGAAGLFVLLMSHVPQPTRRTLYAAIAVGASGVYISGGGFGVWELLCPLVAMPMAYRGLASYRATGVAWLVHSAWDLLHHLWVWSRPRPTSGQTSSCHCHFVSLVAPKNAAASETVKML
jgi:hypothetical protein